MSIIITRMNTHIKKAIEIFGTQSNLAKAINETEYLKDKDLNANQSTVWQWLHGYKDKRPSAIYAIAIEHATEGEVSRYDLRPDIFGEAA